MLNRFIKIFGFLATMLVIEHPYFPVCIEDFPIEIPADGESENEQKEESKEESKIRLKLEHFSLRPDVLLYQKAWASYWKTNKGFRSRLKRPPRFIV